LYWKYKVEGLKTVHMSLLHSGLEHLTTIIMASSTISGIFPIQSNATTNGSWTTFILSIAGDGYNDNQNIHDVVLSIYSLSSMKDKAQEDTVAYISGSLLIINEGPDAIDGPHMVIDAFTLENTGICADDMEPSNACLATANFTGQVTAITNGLAREFGLNVGSYNVKVCDTLFSVIIMLFFNFEMQDKTQDCFEVHLHFNDDNRCFDELCPPHVGTNINVQAKWM